MTKQSQFVNRPKQFHQDKQQRLHFHNIYHIYTKRGKKPHIMGVFWNCQAPKRADKFEM